MSDHRQEPQGASKIIQIILLLIIILAVFEFFYSGAFAAIKTKVMVDKFEKNYSEETAYDYFDERVNILLLGSDSRDMKSIERTDTIIVASAEKSTGKIVMLSIPRDTRVYMEDYGYSKINSASTIGGVEYTVEVVEELLDIPIDYYVLVNFEGFIDIIDAIGGITIDVPEDMYHEDEYHPELTVDLKAGEQKLNGAQALNFVRYRSYESGDIHRTTVQRDFLITLAHDLMSAKTIARLPKLIPAIMNCVETDIGVSDMVLMSKLAYKLDIENITSQTLPGQFLDTDASYWEIDTEQTKTIIDDLYNGNKYEVVGDDYGDDTENDDSTDIIDYNDGTDYNDSTDNTDYTDGTEYNYY